MLAACVYAAHAAPRRPALLSAKNCMRRELRRAIWKSAAIWRDSPGETRFLTRDDLLTHFSGDDHQARRRQLYRDGQVKAVPLEDLTSALGVPAGDMMIAICKDKYRAHYSPRLSGGASSRAGDRVEWAGALSDWPKDRRSE